jgi:hypothetical protein
MNTCLPRYSISVFGDSFSPRLAACSMKRPTGSGLATGVKNTLCLGSDRYSPMKIVTSSSSQRTLFSSSVMLASMSFGISAGFLAGCSCGSA